MMLATGIPRHAVAAAWAQEMERRYAPGSPGHAALARATAARDRARRERIARARASIAALVAETGPPRHAYTATLRGQIRADTGRRSTDINAITPARVARLLRAADDRPILIALETDGGNVAAANTIAKMIQAHRPGAYIHVARACHSAGLIVLAAGRWRAASPAARFHMHFAALSDAVPAVRRRTTARVLRGAADTLDKTDKAMASFLARRGTATTDEFTTLLRADREVGSPTAKRVGLLHRIAEGREVHPALPAAARPRPPAPPPDTLGLRRP